MNSMEKFCINRFFFTITPPQLVQGFISDLKKIVRTAIGHGFEAESSPAYIALFKYNHKTENLLYDTDLLISSLLPFDIHVKGLGLFKHGANKTIYLQTEYKTPVPDLANAFGGESIKPNIILARNLDHADFTKAWESLQNISYGNYFRCSTVIVLKKEPNRWNRYLELPLDKNQSFDSDTSVCVSDASVCVLTDRNDN